MDRARVILIGGFLGAGKTTLLARAAAHLKAAGERVSLLTNDQAPNLVDSEFLRQQGFAVGEVSGGCFCCKFDAMLQALEQATASKADVILGEPVGSCTDLSATVLQPLKDLCGERYRLAPFTVLVDPFRLREVLPGGATRNFPESVYYIFRKQMEEADAIAINKSDQLSSAEMLSLDAHVRQQFPRTPVFPMSARTGVGFEPWLAYVQSGVRAGQRLAEVDYDVYAEGEAVLGWLNARLQVEAAEAIDWELYARRLLNQLRGDLREAHAEPAHLKILLSTHDGSARANLVGSTAEPLVQSDVQGKPRQAGLLVNARVHIPPEKLTDLLEHSLRATASSGVATRILHLDSFSPSRPQPTHRYKQVAA